MDKPPVYEDVHPNPSARWTNRRRMAWISLICGVIVFPFLIFLAQEGVREALVNVAIPYYLFLAGIVGAYVGFATLDDKWREMRYRNNYYRQSYDSSYDNRYMDTSGNSYRRYYDNYN